jgi:hypothetical protein
MTGITTNLAGYIAVTVIAIGAAGAELWWVIHSIHATRRTTKEHQ